jgi:hypothetical protein
VKLQEGLEEMKQNDNTITHESSTKVYQWACRLTSEQGMDDYLWTPEADALRKRLETSKGDLIAVTGLQGSGKTALRFALFKYLFNADRNVHCVKWLGSSEKAVIQQIGDYDFFLNEQDNDYFDTVFDELRRRRCPAVKDPYDIAHVIVNALRISDSTHDIYHNILAYINARRLWKKDKCFDNRMDLLDGRSRISNLLPLMEKRIGAEAMQSIRMKEMKWKLREANVILIDLPDYDRSSTAQMRKDLASIQEWWERNFVDHSGEKPQETSLVIFFQKELYRGHFLMGKLDVYELKPLTPQQLVDCYKKSFNSTAPFTEEALMTIAKVSRGIFRRYKKYIRICLDHILTGKDSLTITPENVRQWISLEQLVQDMELELATMFPKEKDYRRAAVIVLKRLSEEGFITQTQIAKEVFDGSEMKASRLLNRLEAWNYIRRERKGKEKVVSLP